MSFPHSPRGCGRWAVRLALASVWLLASAGAAVGSPRPSGTMVRPAISDPQGGVHSSWRGSDFVPRSPRLTQPRPSALGAPGVLQQVPPLAADRLEHDFGAIRIDGGNVVARFLVRNDGDGETRLVGLFTSCMCTTVRLEFADSRTAGPFGMPGHDLPTTLDRTLRPGEEFAALVTFDPASHGPAGLGPVTRQVVFQTEGRGRLILTLRANVLPPAGR